MLRDNRLFISQSMLLRHSQCYKILVLEVLFANFFSGRSVCKEISTVLLVLLNRCTVYMMCCWTWILLLEIDLEGCSVCKGISTIVLVLLNRCTVYMTPCQLGFFYLIDLEGWRTRLMYSRPYVRPAVRPLLLGEATNQNFLFWQSSHFASCTLYTISNKKEHSFNIK